ncbi:MAG: metallophosphoesterase [Patescibacteria group bacterium]|nr:metallophosphoesterase [Patescibacteria group bacterium]
MLIGVISDTHNHLENLKLAINYLNKIKVALVIHCGDWTSPSTLKPVFKLKAKLKGVLGNCDTAVSVYNHKLEYEWKPKKNNIELFDKKLTVEVDGKKIAATHGHDQELLQKLIQCHKYDLVCYGHFHKAKIIKDNHTLAVNPGSIAGFYGRQIRLEIMPTLAIYDTRKSIAEIIKLK